MEVYSGMLYKYRPAHIDGHNKVWHLYTEKIISDSALYFSDPRSFNDPFELRPVLISPSRQSVKRWMNERGLSSKKKKYILADFSEWSDEDKANRSKDMWNKNLEETQYGICCFTKDPGNIQMWSYYAQDHNGLCFGFSEALSDGGISIEVEYTENRPSFKTLSNMHDRHDHGDLLHHKHIGWKHEQEVRIIKYNFSDSDNRNQVFDRSILTEVIFGCNASQQTIDHYSKLLTDHGFNHVQLKQAVKNDKYFKLDIVDL